MSKRRRTSSIASRGIEEDFEESIDSIATTSSGGPGRKRKKLDPTELCHQLYDTIRNHKKDDGSLLCDAFIRVPKRRQEPSYYEVVSNPIDLLKIQQKLKTDEYDDMEDMTEDVELLIKNAKAFYKRNTQEYKDACELWDLFVTTKNRLLDIEETENNKGKLILKVNRRSAANENKKNEIYVCEDTSESSTTNDDDIEKYEELFTAVMLATDSDNRPLHTEFQLLPSKRKYPEYYKVIEYPIDLKIIATKIQNNEYNSLIEMEKDLNLMVKNACLFNEPGSQIYKDAKMLKKVFTSKKQELEHSKTSSVSSGKSERLRKRNNRGIQSLSAVTAALQDEESDSEPEIINNDDQNDVQENSTEVDGESDDPLWELFYTIANQKNHHDQLLSENFWKLPSKRMYPDYYKEIKNPVSLSQIKAKLKKGDYGTVSEVAGDMNIMWENAKRYNVHQSRLYKDAAKLQKVMNAKVAELLEIDQALESDSDSEVIVQIKKLGRPRKNATPILEKRGPGRPPKEPPLPPIPLKKRLQTICKTLLEYTCEDGRQPMLVFMEKPSKKLYPDYYEIIKEPIDLLTIESRIKNDFYTSEDDLVADFKLMFSNCQKYNEERSVIYEDSVVLEKILMDKVESMTPQIEKKIIRTYKPRKILTPTEQKCRTLFDTIRDYKEPKANRQLSVIFMKLPSKSDYPDYYEVIKNPVDMEKISIKLKNSIYQSLEELVTDFVLMFDNACKYNEPDSQIYKDALILQRLCLKTKMELCENEDSVPDVTAAVQDMLCALFISVYNHQDEEGRCFSDSMAELPEHDEVDGKKIRALSLDLIKRRLDRGVYRRLDTFQEDFFMVLERARRLSRIDSQAFEDSVELQRYFIQQRDEICRNGDLFSSPALNYTMPKYREDIENCKKIKSENEIPDDTEAKNSDDSNSKDNTTNAAGESMTCNQRTFRVGEFVYVEPREKGIEPSIIRIERLWTHNGTQMLYGKFFVRPSETFHVQTRKFLEHEVFLSDMHMAIPLEEVKERCCVLNIKDYIKYRPQGYYEKDIYVCESRYSTKARAFKKIMKFWPNSENLILIEREKPLELKRVMSVFRERVEKHKDELAELEEQEKLSEKEKPNVVCIPDNVDLNLEDGITYYEQYNTICSGVVKTGDCVYVATDGGRQLIAQIDTIWDTKDGKAYFRGPWLVTPPEIPPHPTRKFFKQEVFLSTLEDTNPIVGIVGRCAVLDYNDYISCRPTEIPEVDVYICESIYDELNRRIRKLPEEGLKRYVHTSAVTEDEIYFFRRLINPPKVGSEIAQLQPEIIKPQTAPLIEVESSSMLNKITDVDMLLEDSLDGGPPSVGSGEIPAVPSVSGFVANNVSTPVSSKKKNSNRKLVTGYILYSSEVRKQVVQNNPESTFGDISRIVGNEWRSLPAQEKLSWEEKAAKCNEETKLNQNDIENCSSPAPILQVAPLPDQIYECLWDNCDWQFEDITDCVDHCIADNTGHVQSHFKALDQTEAEFQCLWKGCVRIKKQMAPFPTLARLARHIREVHINKGNGRIVRPDDRSKNFVASSRQINNMKTNLANALNTPQNQMKTLEPLFVAVPPRPQRVLHSEAYIRYIEGLSTENKYISPWERTLNATSENTVSAEEKLAAPIAWLGNGAGNHGSVVKALWALRDFMMKDSLNLNKNL